jgi:tetratricopeptide (TPR) repeat protein
MPETPAQPNIAELLARFLEGRAAAHAAGLAPAESTGEVVPFEAAPVQTVDPRLAWDEAVAAIREFQPAQKQPLQAPADWPVVVAAHEPTVALAFAVGNYPQLVRHLRPMLDSADLTELRPTGGRPVPAPGLTTWAVHTAKKRQWPQLLLALGALRLARHYDAADAIVKEHGAAVPEEWRTAWANEEAALTWHRGQAEKALEMWRSLPESVPVLFNRGMAYLFLHQPAEARAALTKAIAKLPEASAWHHLGRLYLTLAEMRG